MWLFVLAGVWELPDISNNVNRLKIFCLHINWMMEMDSEIVFQDTEIIDVNVGNIFFRTQSFFKEWGNFTQFPKLYHDFFLNWKVGLTI